MLSALVFRFTWQANVVRLKSVTCSEFGEPEPIESAFPERRTVRAGMQRLAAAFVQVKWKSLEKSSWRINTIEIAGNHPERLYETLKPNKAKKRDWIGDLFGDHSLLPLKAADGCVSISQVDLQFDGLRIFCNDVEVAKCPQLKVLEAALHEQLDLGEVTTPFTEFQAAADSVEHAKPSSALALDIRPSVPTVGVHDAPIPFDRALRATSGRSPRRSRNFIRLRLPGTNSTDLAHVVGRLKSASEHFSDIIVRILQAEPIAALAGGGRKHSSQVNGILADARIDGYRRTVTIQDRRGETLTVGGPNATSEQIRAQLVTLDIPPELGREFLDAHPNFQAHLVDPEYLNIEHGSADPILWQTSLAQRNPTVEHIRSLLDLLDDELTPEQRQSVIQAFRSFESQCGADADLAVNLTTALCEQLRKLTADPDDGLTLVYLIEAVASIAKRNETRLSATNGILSVVKNDAALESHPHVVWSVAAALRDIRPPSPKQVAELQLLRPTLIAVQSDPNINGLVGQLLQEAVDTHNQSPTRDDT